MDKKQRLVERIGQGWYDDRLEVLQENAEKKFCYPIWKACTERREVAGVGERLKIPSTALLKFSMPKGITCSLCAPRLRAPAHVLAKAIAKYGTYNLDVGLQPTSIVAVKWNNLDAVMTRVGNREWNVHFYAIEENAEVFYLVKTICPGFPIRCKYYQDKDEATKRFHQEVDDEDVG